MNKSLKWIKSTYSSTGNCIEVADEARHVLVRDTQDRQGPVLRFAPVAWRQFADRVKDR